MLSYKAYYLLSLTRLYNHIYSGSGSFNKEHKFVHSLEICSSEAKLYLSGISFLGAAARKEERLKAFFLFSKHPFNFLNFFFLHRLCDKATRCLIPYVSVFVSFAYILYVSISISFLFHSLCVYRCLSSLYSTCPSLILISIILHRGGEKN